MLLQIGFLQVASLLDTSSEELLLVIAHLHEIVKDDVKLKNLIRDSPMVSTNTLLPIYHILIYPP